MPNFTFRATESVLLSLILECCFLYFFLNIPLCSYSSLARTNNRLDTKKKAACCWPTWKWPRSGAEGREPQKPAAGMRAKVWSLVDWRPSSPEEWVFCCGANRGAHSLPTITTILQRMIDALFALYRRKKTLDICIIDQGEKRTAADMESSKMERQIVWVGVCTWETMSKVCVLVSFS